VIGSPGGQVRTTMCMDIGILSSANK
jgi:hypothetical protein